MCNGLLHIIKASNFPKLNFCFRHPYKMISEITLVTQQPTCQHQACMAFVPVSSDQLLDHKSHLLLHQHWCALLRMLVQKREDELLT